MCRRSGERRLSVPAPGTVAGDARPLIMGDGPVLVPPLDTALVGVLTVLLASLPAPAAAASAILIIAILAISPSMALVLALWKPLGSGTFTAEPHAPGEPGRDLEGLAPGGGDAWATSGTVTGSTTSKSGGGNSVPLHKGASAVRVLVAPTLTSLRAGVGTGLPVTASWTNAVLSGGILAAFGGDRPVSVLAVRSGDVMLLLPSAFSSLAA